MLQSKLENYIIENYSDVYDIFSTEKVREGYLSQNSILKTKERDFFLKQYRDTYTVDSIKDIDKASIFLSKNSIPIVLPLTNKQGKKYFVFNNQIYQLFPFVTGRKLDRRNIDNKSIKSLAKTLAKIHLLSVNGPPIRINAKQGSIDSTLFLKDSLKILEVLTSIQEKSHFDNLVLELLSLKKSIIKENIENIKALKIKRDHLLHGDYHEKNVFLDTKGNVKNIFDLEKIEIGDRLHEIIRSMDFICLNEEYNNKGMEKARVYIKDYNELYPIPEEQFFNALKNYYYKKASSLWIERTHYLEGSNRVDCFLRNQLDSLQFYPQNCEKITKFIYD